MTVQSRADSTDGPGAGAAEPALLSAAARTLARSGLVAGASPADLEPLPKSGLVHDHLRVRGALLEGRPVLLRVPRTSFWGLAPADALDYEAACFARAEPSGHTPRLFAVLPPDDALPFGALVIEEIVGAPPPLPGAMPALATALAAVHRLPVPPLARRPPLLSHTDPVAGTLARIEQQSAGLDAASLQPPARAAIAEELAWARDFAARIRGRPQPVTLALTDTHPGNFLVEPGGRAVFIDLEKALYGSPAIDLAHASLYTSTMWDADCAGALDAGEIRGFYRAYLEAAGPALADALAPWLAPLRRLTWLRTITFYADWRAAAARAGDWPPARLPARQRRHLEPLIDELLAPEAIARQRAEWLGPGAPALA